MKDEEHFCNLSIADRVILLRIFVIANAVSGFVNTDV